MTTPTNLNDYLLTNPELAVALRRIRRLLLGIIDVVDELPPSNLMLFQEPLELQEPLERRMREAQAIIKEEGFDDATAMQLVHSLLAKIQENTPMGKRDDLSLEDAMGI